MARMISLILRSSVTAIFGLVTLTAANAATLRVLTSVALTSALDEIVPMVEKATGSKLNIVYDLIAAHRKRILEGETADVIILSRAVMEELQKHEKLAANSLVNLVGTPVSVAARAGAPMPDISTIDAFKQTLLAARSIVYADPAKGGASGVYFARVLERLGVTEQMKAKTILVPGAQAAEVVARGEAELGVAQGSEIVPVAGAQLVGALPGDLARITLFTAGIGAESKSLEAAKELIEFLRGPAAASRFKAKGFEPG
jgi:molybdate transport system substrate-binding protein